MATREQVVDCTGVLNINNYNLEYDEGDGFILVVGIVRGTLDQKIISTWIENHVIGEDN